jgi:hypothetical protein
LDVNGEVGQLHSNADGSSILATNADGSSILATNADGSSILATNADGSSILATNADGSSILATNADGSSDGDVDEIQVNIWIPFFRDRRITTLIGSILSNDLLQCVDTYIVTDLRILYLYDFSTVTRIEYTGSTALKTSNDSMLLSPDIRILHIPCNCDFVQLKKLYPKLESVGVEGNRCEFWSELAASGLAALIFVDRSKYSIVQHLSRGVGTREYVLY